MAISSDLFQAILAMDAYIRGYDKGLVVSGDDAYQNEQSHSGCVTRGAPIWSSMRERLALP